MINFTIPSYSNMEAIRNTQRIIEGGYYGGAKRITDYAILKGAGSFPDIFTKYRVYPYWLQNETDDYTDHDDLYYGISPAQAVSEGSDRYAYSEDKTVGTRLMMDYDTITRNGKRIKKVKNNIGLAIDIVEYGKYPQSLVMGEENEILDSLYMRGLLKSTGRTYSYNVGSVDKSFLVRQDIEYEYNNQRYVKVKRNNQDAIFPNGIKLINDYYWVKVEPIIWYVNHNEKMAITAKTLIGGVPYNIKPTNGIGLTYLGKFISEVFERDFTQELDLSNSKNKTKISKDAIRVIKKVRKDNEEIDLEFGKVFDEEIKKEKKKHENSRKKVKVIKKNLTK